MASGHWVVIAPVPIAPNWLREFTTSRSAGRSNYSGGIKPDAETSRLKMNLATVDSSGPEEPGPVVGGLLRTTIITSCVLAVCLGLLVVLVLL
jgi:hypothetical protein